MILRDGAPMDSYFLASIALALLVVLGWITVLRRLRAVSTKLQQAEARIEILTDNLNAICSSAVGVDQRVNRLERHGRAMESRQESVESQRKFDRPYPQAIQMVQKGATAERLMEELGLSRSEAELLFMLHGVKEAI